MVHHRLVILVLILFIRRLELDIQYVKQWGIFAREINRQTDAFSINMLKKKKTFEIYSHYELLVLQY